MGLPFIELKGAALDAYNELHTNLNERARRELGLSGADILSRSMIPTDVGLTNPFWTFSITGTSGWQTLIATQVISDNRFVGINGVSYDEGTPLFGDLEISRGGSDAKRWNVQNLPMVDDGATRHTDKPVTIGQNETLNIRGYNGTTSTNPSEVLILNGITVERKGLLLNP